VSILPQPNANSDDHIFPSFLGGKATVAVCAKCNRKFGHTFEAVASRHFKDWMFVFRRCGMQPPNPVVWKGLGVDSSGTRYDIDQDFKCTLTKPRIERDDTGRLKRVYWDPKRLAPIVEAMQKDGEDIRLGAIEKITIDVRQLRLTRPLDDNIKRLCMKMSVAAARRIGVLLDLDHRSSKYLLEAAVVGVCPVRIAVDEYVALDHQRPPVGHLIYVHASPSEQRVYSIVQFFSAMQFYCELSYNWMGDECAVLATHDPVSHNEVFNNVTLLHYPLPEQHIPKDIYEKRFAERFERLRLELVALYGDQAPLSLQFNV
jgi:HNH endonuclease